MQSLVDLLGSRGRSNTHRYTGSTNWAQWVMKKKREIFKGDMKKGLRRVGVRANYDIKYIIHIYEILKE